MPRNREKHNEYMRKYREKNNDKMRKYQRSYYKKFGWKEWKRKYYRELPSGLRGSSLVGRKYELKALELLPNSVDCNKESFKGKWDIEWNGWKIDVKMVNLTKNKYWQFSNNCKLSKIVDYYLLFCVAGGKIMRIYLMPQKVFKIGKCITDSEKSIKYNDYLISENFT